MTRHTSEGTVGNISRAARYRERKNLDYHCSLLREGHRQGIRDVLKRSEWETHHVAGQLAGVDALAADP